MELIAATFYLLQDVLAQDAQIDTAGFQVAEVIFAGHCGRRRRRRRRWC